MPLAPENPPPLAVVMPTRNQGRFIGASIASVMAQGIPGLQLLVQDGASTDGTQALLAELARRHPGLRWVSEPDDGPADALNRGFARALATGAPVLGWLNSDDLYTEGAAARALAALQAHPSWVMVYGEGRHIDVDGQPLAPYPTRPPQTPLSAWRDGCPICQPTAFFRREALIALGGVDSSLRTAFDYEFWLRLFKTQPGRIGQLPEVQALSRLHDEGITLRQREQVALEGMAVLHRHLGEAPTHWLLTHVAEALAACPFEADAVAVKQHLLALAERAAPWLPDGGAARLQQQMQQSLAWRLARPGFGASGVHADGWVGPVLTLRLQQPAPPQPAVSLLRLHGRHAWPRPGRLRLRVQAWSDGQPVAAATAWWRQRFTIDIPVAARAPGARSRFELRASHTFTPAAVLRDSHDQRQLGFQLDGIETLPGPAPRVGYDP